MATPDRVLTELIDLARNPSVAAAGRHEAFAEIVSRFQDLALACAYARLRDAGLAEDAAQDAFLVAWEQLDQLRDPAAFPGWIRRLVLTQCHRRLRSPRLALVPDDEAPQVAVDSDEATEATTAHNSAIVRTALTQLSRADRLVLTLFYGSERSHAEIADWLGVPVTTVARRLAHAKRRIRSHLLDLIAGELRAEQQRSRSALNIELAIRLRRTTSDDASRLDDLTQRAGHARPVHVRTRCPPSSMPVCSYLVEDRSGTPVAYAAATQTIFKPIYDLQLAAGHAALTGHAGDVLLMQILEDLATRDAITLWHWTSTRRHTIVEFLTGRGFAIVRREEDWRLDITQAGRLVAGATRPPAAELRDFALLLEDPALFESTRALMTEVVADDPASRPFLPIHPDTLRRLVRAQRHGVLAISGGAVAGVVAGSMDDIVTQGCRLNIVAVRKDWRRKGLATFLLGRLLMSGNYASARLGAPGDPALTSWLGHCGFVRTGDTLLLERLLRKTVRIPRERLQEYVGRYVTDDPRLEPISIEQHGDALISKARDMRDVLLASSECEFFTRHHYGSGRFERDDTGQVARLVYTDGPHQLVAVRADRA
jgi:RNA polymerase sigma factor (sigma-70 family)